MANNSNYEYINEQSIDPELICIICDSPFDDPLCTTCDHTFCRQCITNSINTGSTQCPICRQKVGSIDYLVQASRTVRNMLDRLPVKCTFCEKTGLQRGNFNDHTTKACSKVHVPWPIGRYRMSMEGPKRSTE